LIFVHVAGEFNRRISHAFLLHRFHIAGRLRVISAGDHKLGVGKSRCNFLERINHQLEPFVGSPLAERKYSVIRIAAAGEVWILGPARQNAVRPDVYIGAAIFFGQDAAVARHKNGHRI
jgi:hypothetical protein